MRSRKTSGVSDSKKNFLARVASKKSGSPRLEIFGSSPLQTIARGDPRKFYGNLIAGEKHQQIISLRGPLKNFKRGLLKIFQKGSGQIILGGGRLIRSHTTRGGLRINKKFHAGAPRKKVGAVLSLPTPVSCNQDYPLLFTTINPPIPRILRSPTGHQTGRRRRVPRTLRRKTRKPVYRAIEAIRVQVRAYG